jgi:hypothetical protein
LCRIKLRLELEFQANRNTNTHESISIILPNPIQTMSSTFPTISLAASSTELAAAIVSAPLGVVLLHDVPSAPVSSLTSLLATLTREPGQAVLTATENNE